MTSTIQQRSKSGAVIGLRRAGEGEPVVLIHGVGMQSAAWAPQFTALTQSHEVIALDLPGHGASAPLPAGSALPDFVTWVSEALDMLKVGPANLVGHSMGALIAGAFAATSPERTRRVALLNGVFRRTVTARTAVVARAAEIAAGKVDLETPLTRWFGTGAHDAAAREKVAGWLTQVDQTAYATAYSAFATGDATYADRFCDISCPFLALTADGDPNSTPAMSQAMAAAVQDGCSVTIAGHRHMVNLTAPEKVTGHLQDWLARIPAAPEVV